MWESFATIAAGWGAEATRSAARSNPDNADLQRAAAEAEARLQKSREADLGLDERYHLSFGGKSAVVHGRAARDQMLVEASRRGIEVTCVRVDTDVDEAG